MPKRKATSGTSKIALISVFSSNGARRTVSRDYSINHSLYGLDPSSWKSKNFVNSIHIRCEFRLPGEHYPPILAIRNNISNYKISFVEYESKLVEILKSNKDINVVRLISLLKKANLIVAKTIDGMGVHFLRADEGSEQEINRFLTEIKIEYSILVPQLKQEYVCTCGYKSTSTQSYIRHKGRCNTARRHNSINPSVKSKYADIDSTFLFDILDKYGLIEWKAERYLAIPTEAAKQYIDLASDCLAGDAFGTTPAQRLMNIIEAAMKESK